ncbi:hypothetical protein EVAR_69716_1 [Eumeta japonica]|uniref:Uncharacterized protein n=1 Tax=Eumeta variegata TaxID=151549 RepID=A0A4C2ACB4_EUMVA|nr:hypothetical protein EVAR_69716_1 [Eumeta japonica]
MLVKDESSIRIDRLILKSNLGAVGSRIRRESGGVARARRGLAILWPAAADRPAWAKSSRRKPLLYSSSLRSSDTAIYTLAIRLGPRSNRIHVYVALKTKMFVSSGAIRVIRLRRLVCLAQRCLDWSHTDQKDIYTCSHLTTGDKRLIDRCGGRTCTGAHEITTLLSPSTVTSKSKVSAKQREILPRVTKNVRRGVPGVYDEFSANAELLIRPHENCKAFLTSMEVREREKERDRTKFTGPEQFYLVRDMMRCESSGNRVLCRVSSKLSERSCHRTGDSLHLRQKNLDLKPFMLIRYESATAIDCYHRVDIRDQNHVPPIR